MNQDLGSSSLFSTPKKKNQEIWLIVVICTYKKMQKMTMSREAHCHLLQLKQNNQKQWWVEILARRHLLHLRKKPRDDNKPPG